MLDGLPQIKEIAERHEVEGRGVGEVRAELFHAISALPLADRLELLGIMLFGRDYTPTQGDNVFAEYRAYLDLSRSTPSAADVHYILEKPIARYLNQAEQKLRGNWPKQKAEIEPSDYPIFRVKCDR